MEEDNKFKIAMVGPMGVGKTSLLAAMYSEIDQEIEKSHGRVAMPSGAKRQQLLDRLAELKRMAGQSDVSGVSKSAQERDYQFDFFWEQTTDPELSIQFVDLPGGWYYDSSDEENQQRAVEVLSSSHASILAVDSVALMAAEWSFHEPVNRPNEIREVYKEAMSGFSDSHVVIITLIRSESYSDIEEALIERTRAQYAKLINTLKLGGVEVYIGTVETVGSLEFDHYDLKAKQPIAIFRNIPGVSYKSERCAVPLSLIVEKSIKQNLETRDRELQAKNTIWGRLKAFITRSDELKRLKESTSRLDRVLSKLKKTDKGGFVKC